MLVDEMRHRIGEWIVHSSGPKGFSCFPDAAWAKLPEGVSWMLQIYAQQYLANELHLEPLADVTVQGKALQSDSCGEP
jgi:hypothetical protein